MSHTDDDPTRFGKKAKKADKVLRQILAEVPDEKKTEKRKASAKASRAAEKAAKRLFAFKKDAKRTMSGLQASALATRHGAPTESALSRLSACLDVAAEGSPAMRAICSDLRSRASELDDLMRAPLRQIGHALGRRGKAAVALDCARMALAAAGPARQDQALAELIKGMIGPTDYEGVDWCQRRLQRAIAQLPAVCAGFKPFGPLALDELDRVYSEDAWMLSNAEGDLAPRILAIPFHDLHADPERGAATRLLALRAATRHYHNHYDTLVNAMLDRLDADADKLPARMKSSWGFSDNDLWCGLIGRPLHSLKAETIERLGRHLAAAEAVPTEEFVDLCLEHAHRAKPLRQLSTAAILAMPKAFEWVDAEKVPLAGHINKHAAQLTRRGYEDSAEQIGKLFRDLADAGMNPCDLAPRAAPQELAAMDSIRAVIDRHELRGAAKERCDTSARPVRL